MPEADFVAVWSAFALPPHRVSDNAPTSLSLARLVRLGLRKTPRLRCAASILTLCEFSGFRRNLAKPPNHDETEKPSITANNRTIWRPSYGISRPSMKMGKVQEETRCAAYQFLFVTLVFFSSVFLTPSSHHDSRTPRGISKSVFHIGSHLRGGRGRRAEEWPIHPRL